MNECFEGIHPTNGRKALSAPKRTYPSRATWRFRFRNGEKWEYYSLRSNMLKPSQTLDRSMKLALNPWICLSCQNQSRWLARHTSNASASSKPAPPKISRRNEEAPILKPLSRPIGQLSPPRPGDNSGKDDRTWRQRRDDFFDYDKHLERRSKLYVRCPHTLLSN